ncbi:hypothetical protein INR49_020474 [Caranx melampygus]|nr:hypothetical protein INR49_020474 [Caranx melampygus]
MSSRADNKTASQFVSLTLRLKDKLHPHRIKHTLSQRKPADPNLQQHTLQHKVHTTHTDTDKGGPAVPLVFMLSQAKS